MDTYGTRFRRECIQAADSLRKERAITRRVLRRIEAWADPGQEMIDSEDPQRALLYLVAVQGNITDQSLHMLGDLGRQLTRWVVVPLWIIAALLALILWRLW